MFNETFPKHTAPEIVNTALEGVALVMKSMGVDQVGMGWGHGHGHGHVDGRVCMCVQTGIWILREAGMGKAFGWLWNV